MKRRAKMRIRKRRTNSGEGRRKKAQQKTPTTSRQYFALSPELQERWDSIAHVISKMRSDRLSLRKAAREFGIDPGLVLRLGRSALRRQKSGRYVAKPADRLLRVLSIIGPDGRTTIAVRDSRQASLIGSYWDAIQKYLQTGDDTALAKFSGKKVRDASGKRHVLLTDLEILRRLGSAGVLSFESPYGGGV